MHTEENARLEYKNLFDKCYNYHDADAVKEAGLYPYFRPIQSAPGDEVDIDGHPCIMIGSNNYLGLVNHPKVKEAAAEAVRKFGSGCTGSRFLNGTLDIHIELEERLAQFAQKDAAQVFSTGFQTNLGVISALASKGDAIIIDKQVHACIVDGCRLSYAKVYKFAHNDMEDFAKVIAQVRSMVKGGILVVVDGVFSMEGDIIKLPELVNIAKQYDAKVLVDDAHGVGVLGKTGAGTAEHFNMIDKVDLTMGTFSKSFASLGGFVAGDHKVIDYIKHHARSLIFSASIPPSNAAAVIACLDILKEEPERLEKVLKNGKMMKDEFCRLGFNCADSETPIVPIIVGDDMEAFIFWKELLDNGVFTNPVVSPAVPPGQAMIRTSYTATHTQEQLEKVVEMMAKVGRAKGLIS